MNYASKDYLTNGRRMMMLLTKRHLDERCHPRRRPRPNDNIESQRVRAKYTSFNGDDDDDFCSSSPADDDECGATDSNDDEDGRGQGDDISGRQRRRLD